VISISNSSFSSAVVDAKVVSCHPCAAVGVPGCLDRAVRASEESAVVDLDARGDVGGAAGDSPKRRWRLWYFNKDGRCLHKMSAVVAWA
jgi:hypothetical protein